jgi:hypothetical protein
MQSTDNIKFELKEKVEMMHMLKLKHIVAIDAEKEKY